MNGSGPLVSLDDLIDMLPDLIADANRVARARPSVTPDALRKATGTVISADATSAVVQLDEDEPGVLSTVQLAAAVEVNDRVTVLLSAGGATVVGSGSAQAGTSGTGGLDARVTALEAAKALGKVFYPEDYQDPAMPWADGNTPFDAAFNAAEEAAGAAGGGIIWMSKTTYGLNAPVTLNHPHVSIQSPTAFHSHFKPLVDMTACVVVTANDCKIECVGAQPNSSSPDTNPVADFIRVQSPSAGTAVNRCRISECDSFYMNGFFLTILPFGWDPANPAAGTFTNTCPVQIFVERCGGFSGNGGVRAFGGGTSLSTQLQMSDSFMYCADNEALYLWNCRDNDIANSQFGTNGTGKAVLRVHGTCGACTFNGDEFGVGQATPGSNAIRFETDGVHGAPFNIQFNGGVAEAADIGCWITAGDGINFSQFNFTLCKNSGCKVSGGLPMFVSFDGCNFNDNNLTTGGTWGGDGVHLDVATASAVVHEINCKFGSIDTNPDATVAATRQVTNNQVRQMLCKNYTGQPLWAVGVGLDEPKRYAYEYPEIGGYPINAGDVPPFAGSVPESQVTNLVPDLAALQAAVLAAGLAVYGDGSDGTITFDGATTVLGLVPAANTYTLTRDIYLATGSALTGTAIVVTAGYRIFCRGTLTIAGGAAIRAFGAAGTLGAGGAGGPAGFYQGGAAGGAGGSGANGATPANITNALGAGGGASGASSGGPGTGGGRPASTVTAPTAPAGRPRNVTQAQMGVAGFSAAANPVMYVGGNGGAGGDAAASSVGGGGGGGAGILGLFVQNLINNGLIRAAGGAGAAGSGTGTGAGGGGGGGGGVVLLVYNQFTGTAPTCAGGNGGAAQGAGRAGAAGTPGTVIQIGNL